MNITKIIRQYGVLLEDLDFMMVFGCCESILPFPKKEIEAALITSILGLKEKNDNQILNYMIVGYQHLSAFLPQEKYEKIKRIYNFGELKNALQDKLFKEQLLSIYNEITLDMQDRLKTLNELLGMSIPISREKKPKIF